MTFKTEIRWNAKQTTTVVELVPTRELAVTRTKRWIAANLDDVNTPFDVVEVMETPVANGAEDYYGPVQNPGMSGSVRYSGD